MWRAAAAWLVLAGCPPGAFRDGDVLPVQFVCTVPLFGGGTLTESYTLEDGGPLACCANGSKISACDDVGSHCCDWADGGFANYCCNSGDVCNSLARECR